MNEETNASHEMPSGCARVPVVSFLMRCCVLLVAMGLVASVGCNKSPYDFAPLSGTVTFDGEPLPGALVVFMPLAKKDSLVSGPDSRGRTDDAGHFVLITSEGMEGAVVGPHKVRISTYRDEMIPDSEEFKLISKEILPVRYHHKSQMTHEVPADGQDDCAFDLTSD